MQELMKPAMGDTRDGCNGTKHSAIEHFLHGIRSLQNM
jgi:hypothetical protein